MLFFVKGEKRWIALLLAALGSSLVIIGFLLWQFLVPFSVITERERLHVEMRGNLVISAIEDYREATGDYPSELDALVPRFLASIPSPDWGVNFWGYRRTEHGFALVVYDNIEYKYPHIVYQSSTGRWTADQ